MIGEMYGVDDLCKIAVQTVDFMEKM